MGGLRISNPSALSPLCSSSPLWVSVNCKMAISINSLCDFTSPVKLGHTSISSGRSNRHPVWAKFSIQKTNFVDPPLRLYPNPRSSTRHDRQLTIPSATDSDKAAVEPSTADSVTADTETTTNQPPLSAVQPEVNGKERTSAEVQSTAPKKSPLTAREKLRAARVLSRYTESKPAKARLGSKVLDALRESDGGKRRSGLPQAPTNLFDDSKRGMPKPGLTFDLPGGSDLFFIALSFVLISTVMFTTTYLVWKLGAIHFNEY